MKTVTIVGVGALGSHVAQFLRNEAQLRVIDFDRVEPKNTLSQFHGKPGQAKLKVEALKNVTQFLWGMKVEINSNKLIAANVDKLIQGSDLVIDCLDNAPSRNILQNAVRFPAPIPCLHGALAADGGFGRVIWDDAFVIDSGSPPGIATCEDGLHLPFIAIVSACIARSAQVFLRTGKKVGFSITPHGTVIST